MMMQETKLEEAVRQYRAREAAERVERVAREELSKTAGVRLQDAVIGQLYHVTALYSGDVVIGKYVGCQGSHEDIASGVHVGAVGYFVDSQQGYRTAFTTSQLEPGGKSAQWFMVALTGEEEERAAAKILRAEEDKAYAAYVAGLPPYLR